MMDSKIKQSEFRVIKRSQINLAAYNPRKISEEARKKLKSNLKKVGLLGGIVWNETTGNLVSGHQKISIIDEVNRYNISTHENDYSIRVEVVEMNDKTEKEQNIFMNNRSVQGEFDTDLLKDMVSDIDIDMAGLDDFDLEMLGIGDNDIDTVTGEWTEEKINDNYKELDKKTSESQEDRNIDRSKNFYEDSIENQIARHNEIEKIKDRISSTNNLDKDNGMLSYVVLSFSNPTERANFMDMFGYKFEDRYIDGEEFMNKIEFGE